MSSVSNVQNQAFEFSNTSNGNKLNLGSQAMTIIADNALLGNTILNGSGITNSLSGLTCSFDNITKLPLLETALFAVNQPPDNSTLSVNSKLYLTNTNPPTAPTKTITIDASNLLIEYESNTNQDLILQSSSSGSLKYRQTGVGATTQELIMNPSGISLTDTNEPSYLTTLSNTQIQVAESGRSSTIGSDSLYIVNGTETMTLGNGGMFFNTGWKIGDMINAGIGGTQQTLEMAAEDIYIASGFDLKLNSGTQIAIDGDCPQLFFPNTNGIATDFVSITNTGTITTKNATKTTTITPDGIQGGVYHTDQPTTAQTYYLSFVQSGGVSGYYLPCFDSATLTYNPSTNLLLVNGLQLSTVSNAIVSFTANYLTIEGNSASSREFNFPITADMNGLTISNRRTNGVYKVMITNSSGAPRTINSSLSTTSLQPNRTSYNPSAVISVGDTWIMTIKVQNFAGTLYNCVSLEKFV
jgi:hypothetical protein